MSKASRNVAQGHTLPPNPHFIDFPRSDGNEGQWLSLNTEREVDHEGCVNYYQPTGIDEGVAIKWRSMLGQKIAQELKMPEGPNYVIRDWPQGYKFFCHNKGKEDSPRQDMYLVGSVNVNRFRSIPEFIPHAIWLMQDETMNTKNCQCKYCSKTPQRHLSTQMGLTQKKSATPLYPQRPRVARQAKEPKAPRGHTNVPYAAVRRQPKSVRYSPEDPKQTFAPARDADLRAACDPDTPRLIRAGELVWCVLPVPIEGGDGGEAIRYWPGLVERHDLHTQAIDFKESNRASRAAPQDGMNTSPEKQETDNDDAPTWNVQQCTRYSVKLLVLASVHTAYDRDILPYQAHAPPDSLFHAMSFLGYNELDPRSERMTSLTVFPPHQPQPDDAWRPPRFADAAASFALAVEIASTLSDSWTPTEEWEYRFVVHPKSRSPTAQSPGSLSLHDVMSAAARPNAESVSAPAGPPPQMVTQIRYQGMWWGAERIWVSDLVRLKISRAQLAPAGHERIYAPSGPSRDTEKWVQDKMQADGEATADGRVRAANTAAADRGVFMLLDGIFIEEKERPEGGGKKKECRVSGMLYEMADKGWDAPAAVQATNGNGNGTGVEPPKTPPPQSQNGASVPLFLPESPETPRQGAPVPNPDPSVSVVDTPAATLADVSPMRAPAAPPQSASTPSSPDGQLSRPRGGGIYPLPVAPTGYVFRPILQDGYEAVLSMTMVAGRYYPHLLEHPLVQPKVTQLIEDIWNSTEMSEFNNLFALEGITPGFHNSVEPREWRKSRADAVREADAAARVLIERHWESKRLGEGEAQAPMEVD